MKGFATQAENTVASVALGGIMLLPLAEIASRRLFGAAIPGSGAVAATLTLWLGMLGAAIAARDGKLLTLATGEFLPKGTVSAVARRAGDPSGADDLGDGVAHGRDLGRAHRPTSGLTH